MLSQLTKTIKMALKSTEDERAILRARSAVQRFPVIEWRQKMEDFHKRSIHASRGIAGLNAWRASDCDGGPIAVMADTDDWNPITQAPLTQPEWDRNSGSFADSPLHSPTTPPSQWSQDALAPVSVQLMPPRLNSFDGARSSITSDEGSINTRGSMDHPRAYSNFLEKANRTIARDQRHAPDPFLDPNPSKPFGSHSRVSSVESITSILDEKTNSPLNKAIASARSFSFLTTPRLRAHNFANYSSPMRTDVSRLTSLRNYRSSTPITPRQNCPSRGSWSRAKRCSSAKFERTDSLLVRPASAPPKGNPHGTRPSHRYIHGVNVRSVPYHVFPLAHGPEKQLSIHPRMSLVTRSPTSPESQRWCQ
jgi:hypothetical protein